jgi:hypothetical protein
MDEQGHSPAENGRSGRKTEDRRWEMAVASPRAKGNRPRPRPRPRARKSGFPNREPREIHESGHLTAKDHKRPRKNEFMVGRSLHASGAATGDFSSSLDTCNYKYNMSALRASYRPNLRIHSGVPHFVHIAEETKKRTRARLRLTSARQASKRAKM